MDYKARDPEGGARGGGALVIHNARAYHATSDIYPASDWSLVRSRGM